MKYVNIIVSFVLAFVSTAQAQSSFGFSYANPRGTSVSVGSSTGFGMGSGVSVGAGYGGTYVNTYAGGGWYGSGFWGGGAPVAVAATPQQMMSGAPPMFVYPQPVVPYYPVWSGGYVCGTILPNCR